MEVFRPLSINDHEWESTVANRKAGRGCSCCAGRTTVLSNCLSTTCPELVKQWHSIKNGELNPSMVTFGSHKKVWWKCNNNHEWECEISGRVSGSGCPVCNESKGENAVAKALKENDIYFTREKRFNSCKDKNPLPFDFVIKSKNGIKIIEYQGLQHYEPVTFGSTADSHEMLKQVQKHDEIKLNWCKKQGVPLLAIPYWRFNDIEKIIIDFLGYINLDSFFFSKYNVAKDKNYGDYC